MVMWMFAALAAVVLQDLTARRHLMLRPRRLKEPLLDAMAAGAMTPQVAHAS